MDEITIGARLRILRRWRGMTLTELAGLAGVSVSYLSMVERGQRMLDRRSYVSAVAAALKVSETDLVGGPHLSADRQQADPHMAIPALREALQTNRLDRPAVSSARPLAELAQEVTARIEPLRADSDYARAGGLLPDVLDELHWHTAHATEETSQRLALETIRRSVRYRRADRQGPWLCGPCSCGRSKGRRSSDRSGRSSPAGQGGLPSHLDLPARALLGWRRSGHCGKRCGRCAWCAAPAGDSRARHARSSRCTRRSGGTALTLCDPLA